MANEKHKSLSARLWQSVARRLHLRDPRRDLSSILGGIDSRASLQDQIFAFAELAYWLRGRAIRETNHRMVRLRFLFQVLDRNPKWKTEVGASLAKLLQEAEAPSLFAQTSLTEQGGAAGEFFRRALDRVLPPAPSPNELSYAVALIFDDLGDLEWLEAMSEDDWRYLADLLPPMDASRLMSDLRDSILKLSVQAAALGFASDVRARFQQVGRTSNFMTLNLAAVRTREGTAADHELIGAVRACLDEIAGVYRRIDTSGISIALVYRLETITGLLKRIELLNGFVDHPDRVATARALVIEIVRTRFERRSIASLFGLKFDLFARKLIEHAGETGEHYITQTWREYWAMFRAAAGGGVITVATTIVKFGLSHLHLAPFIEGFGYGLNYALSFLAMQACGFVLATKQPSMTAAALAGRLSATMDRSRISEFVTIVAQITRSQMIAIAGNVGLVIPGAWLVDFALEKTSGHHVIDAHYALHTLETFHPWKSLTILYAAETGVFLWLSSLCAGWLQNWVIYRRIPEALAHHRTLQAVLGERRAQRLGEIVRHHASGWGGNISVGFMMGFAPEIGKIFGLPVDVRHVTLTAGQMTFAFRALPAEEITTSLIVASVLGLFSIGLMNFVVSTACALFVAVRARRVRRTWFFRILRDVRTEFFRRPLPFLFPPSSKS